MHRGKAGIYIGKRRYIRVRTDYGEPEEFHTIIEWYFENNMMRDAAYTRVMDYMKADSGILCVPGIGYSLFLQIDNTGSIVGRGILSAGNFIPVYNIRLQDRT